MNPSRFGALLPTALLASCTATSPMDGEPPMNVWQHCLLSQRKFGGQPEDFVAVHRFIDHSKLYLYHFKHRLLLHNLYGVELCMERFGDFITTCDGHTVLVRDVAAAHCSEDLSGRVPTLYEWLRDADEALAPHMHLPDFDDPSLEAFVLRPYLRSGLRSALLITLSDFGVGLVERFLGVAPAKKLADALGPGHNVRKYLSAVDFAHKWQYTPDLRELQWLKENGNVRGIHPCGETSG